jgi:urease accessory protein
VATLWLNGIVGIATHPDFAEHLHTLEHRGIVEYLLLEREDTQRHRLRATTDKGTECIIALPRSQKLSNGAILLLEPERAVVVRMKEERWLALTPCDLPTALELGYFAGNMHWRVSVDGPVLHIALEGPEQDYLDRLRQLLSTGRVERVGDG